MLQLLVHYPHFSVANTPKNDRLLWQKLMKYNIRLQVFSYMQSRRQVITDVSEKLAAPFSGSKHPEKSFPCISQTLLGILGPWSWRQPGSPKRRQLHPSRHDTISQQTGIFTSTAVRSPNVAWVQWILVKNGKRYNPCNILQEKRTHKHALHEIWEKIFGRDRLGVS